MKYSDKQRIQKIYDNAEKLRAYIKEHHVTKDALLNDYALQWLVTTPLYNIGEHVYDHSFPLRSKAQKDMKLIPLPQQVKMCYNRFEESGTL